MPEILTRETAPVTGVDVDRRRVTVQLFRWLDPREVSDGATIYREAYAVDSLDLADDMHVAATHHGTVIGRVDPDSYDPSGDGPTVDLILSRSSAGSDMLADIDAGVIRSVSVEVEPLDEIDRDGVTIRTRSKLHGVAFAFRPAHDAPILATREQPQPGDTDMPDTATPTPVDAPVEPAVTTETLTRSLDEFRDEIRRDVLTVTPSAPEPSAVSRFRTFGEFAHAVIHASPTDAAALNAAFGEQVNIVHRALADQTSPNNPGVLPPTWITDVAGSFTRGRAVISAFGGTTPKRPGEGGSYNWPAFEGDITALVGNQAAEKTEITSVEVDLVNKTASAETWAGGSDVAYQLIRNSTPAYLDEYRSLMGQGYAVHSDARVSSHVGSEGVASAAIWDPATGDADDLNAALIEASLEVQSAIGEPARFVLAATDVFLAIASLPGLFPGAYGTRNARGTSDAAALTPEVSGLPVIHGQYLAAGSLVVSTPEAATVYEDGPMVATAEDVARLGHNWAIWGQGAFAARVPNAMRIIAAA